MRRLKGISFSLHVWKDAGRLQPLVALKDSISAGETLSKGANEFWCVGVGCFFLSVELHRAVPGSFWVQGRKPLSKCNIVLLYMMLTF